MYADKSETFNKYVLEACVLTDSIPQLTSSNVRFYKPINDQEIDLNLPKEALDEQISEEKNLNTESKI